MQRCLACDSPLANHLRADAKYCSTACRITRHRRRQRLTRVLSRTCASCRKRIPLHARVDAVFCSNACRQRDHRRRQQMSGPSKAHQRVIRERLAQTEPRPVAANIRSAVVREIAVSEAASLIAKFEWLGTMPAVVRHACGIFFDGELGGAVTYGDEQGENLGVWDRYGYTGQIIALQRGACAHWAHPNSATKLIRRSMDLLPPRFKVITATVDAIAGEIGTIYQAAGFDFVGVMHRGTRAHITVNGKTISERRAGLIAGTQGRRALAKLGFDAVTVRARLAFLQELSELIRLYGPHTGRTVLSQAEVKQFVAMQDDQLARTLSMASASKR